MEDKHMLDCIVVAQRTDFPPSGATSESHNEDNYEAEDTTAVQDVVTVNHQETREAEAKTQAQPQVHSDTEDDDEPNYSWTDLSGVSALPDRVNLSPDKTRKPQNTRLFTNDPQKTNTIVNVDLGNKRPRGSISGDEGPRKRAPITSLDEASDNEGLRSSATRRPDSEMGSQKISQQSSIVGPQMSDTGRAHITPTAPLLRDTATEIYSVRGDDPGADNSSSDEPLAARRWRVPRPASGKRTGTEQLPRNDEEVVSSQPRCARRRYASTDDSKPDDPDSPQATGNNYRRKIDRASRLGARNPEKCGDKQSQAQADELPTTTDPKQNLKNQLAAAQKEISEYRDSLEKERAKNQELEKQRLLWENKRLTTQDEDEAVPQRQLPLQATQDQRGHASIEVQTEQPTRQDAEKTPGLEDHVSGPNQNLQPRHAAIHAIVVQETLTVRSLRSTIEEQQLLLREMSAKDRRMEKKLSDLLTSKCNLIQKVERLELQLSEMRLITETSTRALRTEVDRLHQIIQQRTKDAENIQDELDYHVNQLANVQGLFDARWENREQEFLSTLREVLENAGI